MSKYSLLRYRKTPKVEPNWRTRGDTLRFFIHSVANQKKIGGALLVKNFSLKKSLTKPKKLKGGTLWIFQHPFCRKTPKKLKGGTLWGNSFFSKKKSHSAENTLRQYPLVPLSFLDDVKILLRKLLRQYFKFAK